MSSRLDQTTVEELLGAYALDAVEPWERTEVERHLSVDPRLRAEVQAHREVAGILTEAILSPGTTPPDVWTTIAGQLDEAPPPLELAPVTRLERRRRWRPRIGMMVTAAAAVVAAATLGIGVMQQTDQADLQQAAAAAVTAAGSEILTLVAPADGPDAGARLVVESDGTGYMIADDLPALPGDRTYQLWVITSNAVVSAGIMGSDPGVTAFRVDPGYTGFAITDEVSGGVVSSQNAPVAVWVRS